MYRPSRLSRRVDPAMSVWLNNRVYELQARGEDVTVLSLGEAFFDLELGSLDADRDPRRHHYSHSRGPWALRQKLAEYHRERHGVSIDPERELLVTAGCKAACYLALLCLLDDGDEVLIQDPAWVSYPEQVKYCRGVARAVPWQARIEDYQRWITPRTRVLVLNNPLNPSGKIYAAEELEQLVDLARRHQLAILADETYSEFTPAPPRATDGDGSPGAPAPLDEGDGRGDALGGGFLSLARFDPQWEAAVLTNSLSKSLGISGWRLGYVAAHAELIDQILKANQHIVTCPPTLLAEHVAGRLDGLLAEARPQIQQVLKMRRRTARLLDELQLSYLPGEGTFYLFVATHPSRLGSVAFCERLLAEHRVAAVPGIGYGPSCDGFIRVSVGTEPWPRIQRAIGAIRELVDATRDLQGAA